MMRIITKDWINNLPQTIKETAIIARKRSEILAQKRMKALNSLINWLEKNRINNLP